MLLPQGAHDEPPTLHVTVNDACITKPILAPLQHPALQRPQRLAQLPGWSPSLENMLLDQLRRLKTLRPATLSTLLGVLYVTWEQQKPVCLPVVEQIQAIQSNLLASSAVYVYLPHRGWIANNVIIRDLFSGNDTSTNKAFTSDFTFLLTKATQGVSELLDLKLASYTTRRVDRLKRELPTLDPSSSTYKEQLVMSHDRYDVGVLWFLRH